MVTGRRRDEWDRAAALMSWTARVMTGAKIDPDKLNPCRREETAVVLSPAERKAAAGRWLDGMMGGGKPRTKAPKPEGK